MRLEDKLFLNRYQSDKHSHLRITDRDACLKCDFKPCTYICPSKVYAWSEEENKILTAYEGCVECGSCRYACPPHVIDWRNPRGGFGIQYKFG
ncbi:MAG: 4Fe-4S ferredoxin [Clostridiaceae bacterium BRH_c20a]|nr:MAG: 4Fe-4S ferredoxin [Clostridiaceae bacterium BRH_c20a]